MRGAIRVDNILTKLLDIPTLNIQHSRPAVRRQRPQQQRHLLAEVFGSMEGE